jgi:Bacterial mobilisation protein (MobC)
MAKRKSKDITPREVASKMYPMRFTPTQFEILNKKAEQASLKKSEFIIRLIEDREINQPLSKQELIVLTGVANNLNQLTRFAHLGNLNVDAILEIVQKLKLVLC